MPCNACIWRENKHREMIGAAILRATRIGILRPNGAQKKTISSTIIHHNQQCRMFGGHGAPPKRNVADQYGGFVAPHIGSTHEKAGRYMLIIMYVWVLWRTKEDGLFVLGIDLPWKGNHGHGHGHDDHHDHAPTLVWEKREIGEKPVLVEKH